MIKADFLRTFTGKNLPFFQELRAKHPSAFVEVTISYEEVVRGTHVEKILSISHRWMEPTQPDPDGEQLKAIKAFLVSSAGKRIELVWIDGGSMPQDQPKGTRTKEDKADFDIMLSQVCAALRLGHHAFVATLSPRRSRSHLCYVNTPPSLPPFTCAQVNMLYLGTTVLILFDLSYMSRFWTQFEAWLSMQFATPNGLKSAVGTENARYHIVCIQNAADQAEQYRKVLVDTWATKTPQQAFDFLSKPDVMVTNQSDKLKQLPKIRALNVTVQDAFQAIDAQLLQRVAASAAAVERAKAELQKGERECQAAKERSEAECRAAKERSEAECRAAKERSEAECRAAKERSEAECRAAKAELQKGERECQEANARSEAECQEAKARADAKVVPLAGVMTRAEGEAAAARAAKQTHVLAIKRGVMPMLMEREAALPPRLKLEGGSLPGAAAEYVGIYMLDGTLVNGRPAWKHTNGRCWVAFDGADWRGQPEADLGQKRGALMLTDADAASPDASSATWQAWTGSAWAAQPALKCTVATAAELSAAQAALASAARAASLQALRSSAGSCLASISGCCVSSAGSCVSAAGSCLSVCCVCTEHGYVRLGGPQPPGGTCLSCISGRGTPEQVKHFYGPCAANCKPLAPCCCVSADGEAIFGCVPTYQYLLPACLHMVLCPQMGCGHGNVNWAWECDPKGLFIWLIWLNLFCCFYGSSPEGFEPAASRTARLGPRPARPSCAPTAERPPAPHACSTRLAVLRVCCWEWRCGSSTWRCCKLPQECVHKTFKCCYCN
jgi:hypothetical protein